jgi:UrcA family protein
MQHRYYISVLAALGVIATSHPATARAQNDPLDTVSVKVSYGDLNLQSEAGARMMLQRIRHAAKSVCQFNLDYEWEGTVLYLGCVHDATQHAVAKLHSPLVSAINGADRGKGQVVLATTRP